MNYLSVADVAKKWNISERSVRNYCSKGRIEGAFLTGKTWNIPENAKKPERMNKRKEKKSLKHYLLFYKKKKQVNTLVVFIIKHKLI